MEAKEVALCAVKGAFAGMSKPAEASPAAAATAEELEGNGFGVLAVAVGWPTLTLAGLIALERSASPRGANLIKELKAVGVRIVMVTRDAPATSKIIANEVPFDGAICLPGPIPPTCLRKGRPPRATGLVLSSVVDLLIASTPGEPRARHGPPPIVVIGAALAAAAAFAFRADFVKVPVSRRLKIVSRGDGLGNVHLASIAALYSPRRAARLHIAR